jgi:hypothetical protein
MGHLVLKGAQQRKTNKIKKGISVPHESFHNYLVTPGNRVRGTEHAGADEIMPIKQSKHLHLYKYLFFIYPIIYVRA